VGGEAGDFRLSVHDVRFDGVDDLGDQQVFLPGGL
jgi:hypothetical protein